MSAGNQFAMGSNSNVASMGAYRASETAEASGDDEGLVDKNRLVKLIGGVVAFFIVVFGATFLFAQSQGGAQPQATRVSFQQANQPAISTPAPQLARQEAPQGPKTLADLDIPGLVPAPAPASRAPSETTASPVVQSPAARQATDAATQISAQTTAPPNANQFAALIQSLEGSVDRLAISIDRLADETAATSETNEQLEEMLAGLGQASDQLKLVVAESQLRHRRPEAPVQAQPQGVNNTEAPAHSFYIKGNAGPTVFLGRKDDPTVYLSVQVGSTIDGLGRVQEIRRDRSRNTTIVVAEYGSVEG